ncbi:hypothetical protein Q4F19_01615 [Sphingomonas sp. BIUV-7]|uniref:PAS domain-containing protein n=1 Tax=Sphingomonas natans TaxID=3063330 RepID=A0ABT8Y5S7_9SPHN|nr:hypothetical protein [Sphingomonas sp. BIUV-7]MDO6413069.1 hypothetical protein [Sphingomonas sp. BIUV-7]
MATKHDSGKDASSWSRGTSFEPLPVIASERRLHVRAFNYWRARADGRAMPTLADCADIETMPFAGRMAIVDLARAGQAARIRSIGSELAAELPAAKAGASEGLFAELIRRLPAVATRRTPIGFEADVPDGAESGTCYRGILLPIADETGVIAHVLGVVNWRHLANRVDEIDGDVSAALASVQDIGFEAKAPSPWSRPVTPEAVREPASSNQRIAMARTWAAMATTDRARGRSHLHAAIGAAHDALSGFEANNSTPMLGWIFGDHADLEAIERVLAGARKLGITGQALTERLDAHPEGLEGFLAIFKQARPPAHAPITRLRFRLSPIASDLLAQPPRRDKDPRELPARRATR